jgi:hypothetical protein
MHIEGTLREKYDGFQKYFIQLSSSNTNISIDVTINSLKTAKAIMYNDDGFTTCTNFIKINGEEIYNFNLLKYDIANSLALTRFEGWTTTQSAGVTSAIKYTGNTQKLNILTNDGTIYNSIKIISPKIPILQNDIISFSVLSKVMVQGLFFKAEVVLYDNNSVALNSQSITLSALGSDKINIDNYVNNVAGAVFVGITLSCFVNTATAIIGGIEIKNPHLMINRL